MLVYRIVFHEFAGSLSASGWPGRWNLERQHVIYAAESIPLAFLELMVRRQGVGFGNDFKIIVIELPARAPIKKLNISTLPKGWNDLRDLSISQPIGSDWYEAGTHLVLKVPSVIMPGNNNFVINTTHVQFKKVKIVAVTDLIPDGRIEEILLKNKQVNP